MIKTFLSGLLICFFITLNAQNLVPNPYFTDTIGNICPHTSSYYGMDEVAIAKGWSSFGATPDYFNSCGTSGWNVPKNGWGFQTAVSGNAYCGLVTGDDSSQDKNYRELIGAELITPLIAGNKYLASIKVSLANLSSLASNKIGISFSTVPYKYSNSAPINNRAIVYDKAVIVDTVNWTIISGSFIADSAYKYVIVGNFFQDDSTDEINLFPPGPDPFAYYYIGYVSVIPDTSNGIINITKDNSISIFPNPSNGLFNLSSSEKINEVELFDVEGRFVTTAPKSSPEGRTWKVDLSDKPLGVYFLRAITNNKIFNDKLILE